jgi:hypothetical protein
MAKQPSGDQGHAQGSAATHQQGLPKQGDTYHCERCGMAFEITTDCHCDSPEHVRFECCNQEMSRG